MAYKHNLPPDEARKFEEIVQAGKTTFWQDVWDNTFAHAIWYWGQQLDRLVRWLGPG